LPDWIVSLVLALVLIPAGIAAFFYAFTKGALILREMRGDTRGPAAHVYPLYSRMWLIRLVDFQPVISAILLCQYGRLVSLVTGALRSMALQGQDVLITSCAFGNVMPRVVQASILAGARGVKIVDIVDNELIHARSKMPGLERQVEYLRGDATAMQLASGSVAANVLFFLLHELGPEMKRQAIAEAARLLAPGGKLFLVDFHRPEPWPLRALSWTYFKVFEPFGLALWDTQDPLEQLQRIPGLSCERRTALFGNFQVIVATRGLPA
jgi:SAM-dependent methyltransferase